MYQFEIEKKRQKNQELKDLRKLENERIKELYTEGTSKYEIAGLFNLSATIVEARLRNMGAYKSKSKTKKKIDFAPAVIKAFKEGHSPIKISFEVGLSLMVVYAILKKNGLMKKEVAPKKK